MPDHTVASGMERHAVEESAGDSALPAMPDVPEEIALRRLVGPLLQAIHGRRREIVRLRSGGSPFATRPGPSIISGELDGGEEFSFFVKRSTGDGTHPDKRRRDREAQVYERLLQQPGLPVARWYGACPVDALVIEYLDGWDLRYHDIDVWVEAARALARLHVRFAGRQVELRAVPSLLLLDGAYLHDWARRALEALSAGGFDPGRLVAVLEGYDAAAALVAAMPPTLVHNDLAPKNVIATSSPPRTTLVDWELAGIGCPLLDIVHLMHGLQEDDERRVRAAYLDELRGTDLLPAGTEFGRVLAACRLHKSLYRLAHPHLWTARPHLAEEWLRDVERDWEAL
jgi:aminoglycoside phosphotransferase (APT) family kinase protein